MKKIWAWFISLFVTPKIPPPPAPLNNFPFALARVLRAEGGFSNLRQDTPTNFGITAADLSKWRGYPVTISDVRQMNVNEASSIYRSWYWKDVGLNQIKSQAISAAIFDQGVLMGTQTAARFAQMALNNCGASLAADGMIGPNTVAAIEQVDVPKFLLAYRSLVKEHYVWIAASNPSKQVFLTGWMNRADRLLLLSQTT